MFTHWPTPRPLVMIGVLALWLSAGKPSIFASDHSPASAPIVRPSVAGQTLIVEGANSPYFITADDTWDAVWVGNVGTGVISQSAGTFTIRLGSGLYLGKSGAASRGTYNLSGGTLTLGSNSIYVGNAGAGSIVQSGTSQVSGTGMIYLGSQAGSVGSYTLRETATLKAGWLYVGFDGAGDNTYTQSGGVATFSGDVSVGYYTTAAHGIFNLSGGTLSTTDLYAGYNGVGVVNQSGGTLKIGGLTLGESSSGNGTYNLNGGMITTTYVEKGAGTGVLNFNGGILQTSFSTISFMRGLSAANVQQGGVIIDSDSYSITVNQALVHDTATLGISADGGLRKLGTGSLKLSGASTYTGGTRVLGGTLILANDRATGDGPVEVGSGATLTGPGTIRGALSVLAGGIVSLSGANTLTVNGSVTNNGTIRLKGGAALIVSGGGSFVNNTSATLDVITGSVSVPGGPTNNGGVVLDARVVKARSVFLQSRVLTVVIDGYTGHTYQLQRSGTLTSPNFGNVGGPQNGVTGQMLNFTDDSLVTEQGFYRVEVD